MAIGRINASLTGVQPGGLAKIVPTSVTVGSGSATVNGNGSISFSGATSVLVNNVFTSAYRNYFLTWESTSPASQYPNYRLSTGGTPNSTSNYSHQRFESSGAGSSSQRTTDSVFSLQTNNTRAFVATLYIFAPQVAEKTFVITHTMHINDLTFTQPVNMNTNGIFNDTTQFDGIQLLPNTSNITGTLSVYGYAQ
jgi:hypothetical protein